MRQVRCLVVGAGVVGLAVARELALRGHGVLIAESQTAFGSGVSSRSSEVIHAGLYYPQGSLKARLCVRGRGLLYAFCEQHEVPHRRIGKWIVAVDERQRAGLDALARTALDNGVSDVRIIDRRRAGRDEPQLRCVAALVSPSSGIVDSHAYMLALLGAAEDHGATLATRCELTRVRRCGTQLRAEFGSAADHAVDVDWMINGAGLQAPSVAHRIEGFPHDAIATARYAKGSYFALSGPCPFSRLIYPMPEPGGLGVHLTLDLDGRARFGPDVEWVDGPDYTVDPQRAARFYAAIRRYWPGLADGRLQPAFAGVRPRIAGPHEAAADFRIEGPRSHGFDGVINLFGIDSPGLTASLAIGERVADLVDR